LTTSATPAEGNAALHLPAQERLIVALDMPDEDDVLPLIEKLGDAVSFYKVGYVRLFSRGTELVKELIAQDKKVFLDLKFWDVPNTVASNVKHVADLGVSFATVHGNGENITRAREAALGTDLKILAVTILTSLNREDVLQIYGEQYDRPVSETVVSMARYLLECGCDGVISSAEEAAVLREQLEPGVLIVTPGIRDAEDDSNDHKRLGTSEAAIKAGADYIVVGRPIYQKDDPRRAATIYTDGIQRGLQARSD